MKNERRIFLALLDVARRKLRDLEADRLAAENKTQADALREEWMRLRTLIMEAERI